MFLNRTWKSFRDIDGVEPHGVDPATGEYPEPQTRHVADIDNDGRRDLLIHTTSLQLDTTKPTPWIVLRQTGNGLTNATEDVFADGMPKSLRPLDEHVADFNGDGRNDLFTANIGNESSLPLPGTPNNLFLSRPDGQLHDVSETNLPYEAHPTHGIAVGGFDDDGDLDAFENNFGGGRLLINDGHGGFEARPLTEPGVPDPVDFHWVVALDANEDGLVDLLPTNGSRQTQVLLSRGDGTFEAGAPGSLLEFTLMGQDVLTERVQTADLTGDGRPDVLFASTIANEFSFRGSRLHLIVNNGDGTVTEETGARMPAHLNGQNAQNLSENDAPD